MNTSLAAPAEPDVPGWTLKRVPGSAGPLHRTTRTYSATPAGRGAAVEFQVHRVAHHPLRACYPYGAHDLAVSIARPTPEEGPAARLLQDLVPALFTADPRCRRVIAAPDEDDTATQLLLEQGGFHRVAEADLPDGSVALYAVEPPRLAGFPTALDDMPH